MINGLVITEENDGLVHIRGTYRTLMHLTLCGWVDVGHEYVEAKKITCQRCIKAMAHVKSLKKGKDY